MMNEQPMIKCPKRHCSCGWISIIQNKTLYKVHMKIFKSISGLKTSDQYVIYPLAYAVASTVNSADGYMQPGVNKTTLPMSTFHGSSKTLSNITKLLSFTHEPNFYGSEPPLRLTFVQQMQSPSPQTQLNNTVNEKSSHVLFTLNSHLCEIYMLPRSQKWIP